MYPSGTGLLELTSISIHAFASVTVATGASVSVATASVVTCSFFFFAAFAFLFDAAVTPALISTVIRVIEIAVIQINLKNLVSLTLIIFQRYFSQSRKLPFSFILNPFHCSTLLNPISLFTASFLMVCFLFLLFFRSLFCFHST